MAGQIDSHRGEGLPPPPVNFADQRGAQRIAVMIRTAKLVCSSGEFLCVVRDVSATGVRLKLFHDLPDDFRLSLHLTDGVVHPVDLVWVGAGQAGFRFERDIDVETFVHGHSGNLRHPVHLRLRVPVFVGVGRLEAPVMLTGLSQQGADFECTRHLAVGEPIRLWCEGLPVLVGTICSRSGNSYGAVLRSHFGIGELARLAAELQLGGSRSMPV